MKTKNIIGMVAVIVLTIHFAAGGLIGFQGKKSPQILTIEKVMPPPVAIQGTINPGEQLNGGKSIFSKATIISLIVAVMGIVAFRRNTFS
jgi:hypothetical protein